MFIGILECTGFERLSRSVHAKATLPAAIRTGSTSSIVLPSLCYPSVIRARRCLPASSSSVLQYSDHYCPGVVDNGLEDVEYEPRAAPRVSVSAHRPRSGRALVWKWQGRPDRVAAESLDGPRERVDVHSLVLAHDSDVVGNRLPEPGQRFWPAISPVASDDTRREESLVGIYSVGEAGNNGQHCCRRTAMTRQ